jgi:uncharacterized membrane protein
MRSLIVFLLIAASITAFAHEGKKHNNKKKAQVDSIMVDSIRAENMEVDLTDENKNKPFNIEFPEMLFEHFHNKTVHFTVALALAAFLFTILNFKWKQFGSTIKILVILSALSSIIAVFTGLNQAKAFYGEPIEWLVILHRNIGIASAVSLLIWAIMLFIKKVEKYAWVIGLLLLILISLEGFYGGIIAAS